jgi:hypothetical protein
MTCVKLFSINVRGPGWPEKRGMLSNKRYFYGMRAYGQIMGQWRTPLRDLSAVVVYFFNARPPGDCFGQRRYSQISLAHLIVADRFTAVTHRGAQQQGSLTRLIWKKCDAAEIKENLKELQHQFVELKEI